MTALTNRTTTTVLAILFLVLGMFLLQANPEWVVGYSTYDHVNSIQYQGKDYSQLQDTTGNDSLLRACDRELDGTNAGAGAFKSGHSNLYVVARGGYGTCSSIDTNRNNDGHFTYEVGGPTSGNSYHPG